MVQIKTALGGIPVQQAMLTDFQTVTPQDSLKQAIGLILSSSQTDFPVVENSRLVGVLTRTEMMRALATHGQDVSVASIMNQDFQIVDANEMLEPAFLRLQNCGCHTMPVTRHGQLVGMLTSDNIGEFLMIQSALGQARQKDSRLVARGA